MTCAVATQRLKAAFGWLLTLAPFFLAPSLATAQTELPLELTWPQVETCPSGAQLEAAVANMVGSAQELAQADTIVAQAAITTADAQFELRLTTERTDRTDTRTLRGDSCQTVADAAAIVLALLIDPNAEIESAPISDPEAFDEPVEASEPASNPSNPPGTFLQQDCASLATVLLDALRHGSLPRRLPSQHPPTSVGPGSILRGGLS